MVNKIAFGAPRNGSGKGEIFTTNPNGTNMKNVTDKPNSNLGGPEWSPFNKSEMIIVSDENGLELYIFNLGDKSMNKISECSAQGLVSETKILCEQNKNTEFSIMDIETRSISTVLKSSNEIGSPDWRLIDSE
jgi:Tol biopolymer transport system component